jgi:DNA polymerase III gamma/tau subunit
MNNKENSLLNERYRPLTLDKFVGNEHLKTAISGYLETK